MSALATAAAEAAATALVRGASAADAAVVAQLRVVRAEGELSTARREVTALREELVWAFAAGRADAAGEVPVVIDLRRRGAAPA